MFGKDDHDDAKSDGVSDSDQSASTPPNEVVHPDPPVVAALADDDKGAADSGSTDTVPQSPSGPEPGPSLAEVFSAGETKDDKPPTPTPPPPPVAPPTPPVPPPEPPTLASAASTSDDNDLIDLKREALTKLSPLVDELDQPPDEKFRTLMMMIQASDDQKMVRHAYDTALKIEDDKERAQALLDIVNEINYFTQSGSTPPDVDQAL